MSPRVDHAEVFERAVEEGERRLGQSTLELASTSVIAGYTVVFGIVALGIVHAAVEPEFGEVARIAGALAFGVGVVFLIAGEAELFAENLFDPAATVVERSATELLGPLLRLWTVTLVGNLAGGVLVVLVLSVEGVLPPGTAGALETTAEEVARRDAAARLASAIAGGALVALLSFFLVVLEEHPGPRLAVTYVVGVLLAIGPFDHVVVSLLHLGLAVGTGAPVEPTALASVAVLGTAGNLVGGLGLVTTTHVVQAVGAESTGR